MLVVVTKCGKMENKQYYKILLYHSLQQSLFSVLACGLNTLKNVESSTLFVHFQYLTHMLHFTNVFSLNRRPETRHVTNFSIPLFLSFRRYCSQGVDFSCYVEEWIEVGARWIGRFFK